ncbi:CYFA0S26e00518g1_1 [Cyberlindnera fabianii]|uniref:Oxidation resistance protein 1 n=2 Tax=Cyberlindnera fabianii TaxID=36022 RepID=A0A061BA59_CYBFA|nr:CYFA0S26e00518g1_1 [Cyberlindnera fabianii]
MAALRSIFGGTKGKSSSKSSTSSKSSSKSPSPAPDYLMETPPLTPLQLQGYLPTTRNRIMSRELGEDIRSILPARQQIRSQWQLLYSLEQHGSSLHTLYRSIKPDREKYDKNGYVLVIKDTKGGIFGSYTNEYLHPTDTRRFFGNGECFLWKSKIVANEEGEPHVQFKAFPYTGLNDYIIYCTSKFLSLGGGDGHYGLWVDEDLMNGVSDSSLTFGNEPLSEGSTKFNILGVEVWKVG